jgi:periplasmic nitrate reductase NapE
MNGHLPETENARRTMPAPPAPQEVDDSEARQQRKTEEFRTWFFLTVVMAPVLAVLIVSAYGLAVWIYQLIAGPPGS